MVAPSSPDASQTSSQLPLFLHIHNTRETMARYFALLTAYRMHFVIS